MIAIASPITSPSVSKKPAATPTLIPITTAIGRRTAVGKTVLLEPLDLRLAVPAASCIYGVEDEWRFAQDCGVVNRRMRHQDHNAVRFAQPFRIELHGPERL